MHLVYLQNLCITIVFDFFWGDCNTQENLATMVTHWGWGGGGVGWSTRCVMVYVTVVSKLQECVSVLNII